jgi:hypothetical protein
MVHTFENFQKMVDNAILVECARQEMGEQKRKFEPLGQINNNSHPCYTPPQGTPALQPTGSTAAASSTCMSVSAAFQVSE